MRQFLSGLAIGLVALPLSVFVAGSFGLLPTASTATPPAWEVAFARHALHAAAAARAPHLQNPVAPTDTNLRAGMKFYRDQCEGCHKSPGHEHSVGLYPAPPLFASHPPRLPDWQLYWIVKNGVRYSGMFAWDGDVRDVDIWRAVTFLSHLDSLPPSIAADWRTSSQ